MHTPQFPSIILLAIIFISFYIPKSHSQADNYDEQINHCSNLYSCGQNIQGIGYPFYGRDRPTACGLHGFELNCQDADNITTTVIDSQTFRVLSIDQFAHTITLARNDLLDDVCPQEFVNTALNYTLYSYTAYTHEIQFLNLSYSCPSFEIPSRNSIRCSIDGRGGERIGFYLSESFWSGDQWRNLSPCETNITVAVNRTALEEFMESEEMTLRELLEDGFRVGYRYDVEACWACVNSDGLCWYGTNSSSRSCICNDGVRFSNCSRPGSSSSNLLLRGLVVGGALTAGLCIGFIMYCYYRRKSSMSEPLAFWKSGSKNDKNIEAFITQYGFSTPKRYKYSEIKRMTNSFKDELGRGGFGSVFKGTQVDGSLVAVKVLKESKGSGEEFINEVASISRTSHVNIVALLGFCYEGRKRALVYEFMPKGSLEKFIYCTIPKDSEQHLGVEKLYEIALGIARGLEYLHRGCNTRILHFDIKPHNILLDEDFCPKISDFGLAKLLSGKESIVSMVEARGTIGYIAPEVFNRNFGGVSHKSDVYSYGMMVLEMVGGRKNIDVRVVHSSEIYFPQWIYKRLEQDEDLGLQQGPMTMAENEIARKMTIVGLWCIQADPSQRPSMKKVIEMLEGSLETLKIPPNPFFSSPRSPATSSTTMERISLQ